VRQAEPLYNPPMRATSRPSVLAPLGRAAGWLVDVVLPPRCLACGVEIEGQGGRGHLCPVCWASLAFVAPPFCACCGFPFPLPVGEGTLCAACLARQPAFDAARAALVYDDASRPLVLGFKHGDRTHAAAAFAAWMARAGADLLREGDLVVPVPLHRRRLFARRYNQAALMAAALARLAGLAHVPDALVRRRPTPSQGGLGREARFANVQGAFAVRPSRTARMQGSCVILVDDVMTTGATLEACATALRKAGAARVAALTLARVVRVEG